MKFNDEERIKALKESGFDVIRVTNDEVTFHLDEVLNKVHTRLSELPDKKLDESNSELLKAPSTGGGLGRHLY
jgi:very-short-patch-repair endonuclease